MHVVYLYIFVMYAYKCICQGLLSPRHWTQSPPPTEEGFLRFVLTSGGDNLLVFWANFEAYSPSGFPSKLNLDAFDRASSQGRSKKVWGSKLKANL